MFALDISAALPSPGLLTEATEATLLPPLLAAVTRCLQDQGVKQRPAVTLLPRLAHRPSLVMTGVKPLPPSQTMGEESGCIGRIAVSACQGIIS